eukprot:TCALIF_12950-PA protein Name:"Protein of unknown function" AED:0.29 eAED:0.29 QI:386/0.5/0.33/1/0.5/0.66/3/0/704
MSTPRTNRGSRLTLLTSQVQNLKKSEDNHEADQTGVVKRKPLIWANDADFNLTALIDSVEKDIQRLENMESQSLKRREANQMHPHPSIGPLESHREFPLTEEILSLPGYKPKLGPMKSPLPKRFSEITNTSTPVMGNPCFKSLPFSDQDDLGSIPPVLPPKQSRRPPLPDFQKCPRSKAKEALQSTDLNLLHQRLLPKHNCVTNILYSRRLPSPPIFRRNAQNETIVVSPRSKDDLATIELASHLTNHQDSRKLFCPLCTQTFGYTFGLECHLLSIHFKELQDFKRRGYSFPSLQKCPECKAQFLKINTVIRHLVYHHPDYVTSQLLNLPALCTDLDESNKMDQTRYVHCRFCKQQFLRRHQKLLMMHLEQKHVQDLESILVPTLVKGADEDKPVEVRLMMASPSRGTKVIPDRPFARDHHFIRPSTETNDPPPPRRSLRFSIPETQNHHYYDIIEDSQFDRSKGNEAFARDDLKKRERSSEEELSGEYDSCPLSMATMNKMKQVKKRLKRIDNRNTEKRRSQELQDLLKLQNENSPPCEIAVLSRQTSYHKHRTQAPGPHPISEPTIPTPANIRARKSFRRSGDYRPPPKLVNALAETYKSNPQPDPFNSDQSTNSLRSATDMGGTFPKSLSNIRKKLYKCNLCEVAFIENAFLLTHLKNKHRSTMSKALRPQYSCAACPAKFFKNSFLVKHVESHQFELMPP